MARLPKACQREHEEHEESEGHEESGIMIESPRQTHMTFSYSPPS